MGVMQRLREQTHVILWGVLILFLLSMTVGGLVGGANVLDIFSKNSGVMNLAGKINDNEIEIRQFSDALQYQTQMYREQGQEIDSRTYDMISDRVWNSFVNELLINELVDEYGFQASDEEIFENLEKNPPSFLQSQPAFQTDGQFDYQKYYQALTNPQGNEWLGVEYQLRAQIPMSKVANYVMAMASVSEEDVKNDYLKKNVKYTLETLSLPISVISKDEIEVTDQEIEKYYKENKEDYLQAETRDLKYVSFDIKPSKNDTMSVKVLAEDLITRVQEGESFETVAAEYTEDPSGQNNGGDLGWFGEGKMVKPFEEACFTAKKGALVGPVLTQFGYHVIKVEDFRKTDGKEEVKARHILLKIKVGPETSNAINSEANLFAYDANELGFEQAVETIGAEIKTAEKVSKDTKYIGSLGFLPSAVRFAFSDKPVGEVSKLFQTENAFVIFKLEKINPEHYKPLEDVTESIKNSLISKKREAKLADVAKTAFAEIKGGKSLSEIAAANGSYAFSKVDSTALTSSIGSLGRSNKVVGAVLSLDENETSGPIDLGNKYGFVKLVAKTNFDEEKFNAEKDELRKTLLNNKRNTYYNIFMQSVRDNADIVDNRANIF